MAIRPGDTFLALHGERFDGHDYVRQAVADGAVAAIVERPGVVPDGAGWIFFTDFDGCDRRAGGNRISGQAVVGEGIDRDWLRLRTGDEAPPASADRTAAGGRPIGSGRALIGPAE